MDRNLIIFIDSLPFFVLEKNKNFFINSLSYKSKTTPGIGFSVNLYSEIFCGLQPDEVGFFNEWTLDEKITSKSNKLFFKMVDYFNYILLFSVVSHKAYSKIFKKEIANIPFCYTELFKKNTYDVFSYTNSHSFLSQHNFCNIVSSDYNEGVGNRDIIAYKKAKNEIKNKKNLFISFVDLDNIAHIYGLNSNQYINHLNNLDSWYQSLIEEFKSINKNKCNIFIISDHGMAKVSRGVKLNLEKYFGEIGHERYIYFIDSVFLRVWIKDSRLKSEISEYLTKLGIGVILDENYRKKYHITNKTFGDLIFQLNEGINFCPNYHGWRLPKAMHGYAPELESQKGVFIYESNDNKPSLLPSNTIEMHNFITNKIKKDNHIEGNYD